ncbi:hypothetical protein ACH5RR_037838 [Cinchona calisaya]|uniref:F-box associated beta-propeller type 1 domain-containing protein n=1 Tax=Cinchona calisaya TaxID=153742 RepID=A0ABD2YBC9_9GENT
MLQHKFRRILSLMRNYIANNPEDGASHQELWQEFERIWRYLDDGMNTVEQDARDLTALMMIEYWYVYMNGRRFPPQAVSQQLFDLVGRQNFDIQSQELLEMRVLIFEERREFDFSIWLALIASSIIHRVMSCKIVIKPDVRFRCVSKTWRDLISSPYFADMHLGHGKNHRRVVLVKRIIRDEKKALLSFHSDIADFAAAAAPDLKLPSPHHNTSIELFGTCNGIVCIAELARLRSDLNKDKINLCNFTTREFLTLPPSPFGWPDEFEDGYTNTTSLGFGFDPSTQDYKLVKFVGYFFKEITTEPLIGVQIYQLKTNSWRNLGFPPTGITYLWTFQSFCASILVNGSLIMHWCASRQCEDWCRGILSFNMCTEAFQNIEFPPDYEPIDTGSNLAVLNDSLALFLFKSKTFQPLPPPDIPDHSIDIWVMMEYGIKESWVKKYSVEPFSLLGHEVLNCTVPWYSWNDNILLLQSVNGLISCSVKDKCCQQICNYDMRGCGLPETIVYEETLVSFGRIGHGLYWRKIDGNSTWN